MEAPAIYPQGKGRRAWPLALLSHSRPALTAGNRP